MLARAGAVEDDLEHGVQPGRADGKLGHNCSGKHAGMLAACRANGWPMHPYRDPDHPLQQRIVELVGPGDVAVDGCGVPTVAMPIGRMAERFTTIPTRIVEAMLARPELVGGSAADDTELMHALPGLDREARGRGTVLRASRPTASAGRSRSSDGSSRALRPAIGQVLGVEAFRTVPLHNSLGEVVGSIR